MTKTIDNKLPCKTATAMTKRLYECKEKKICEHRQSYGELNFCLNSPLYDGTRDKLNYKK